jgi:hypothetical protein
MTIAFTFNDTDRPDLGACSPFGVIETVSHFASTRHIMADQITFVASETGCGYHLMPDALAMVDERLRGLRGYEANSPWFDTGLGQAIIVVTFQSMFSAQAIKEAFARLIWLDEATAEWAA